MQKTIKDSLLTLVEDNLEGERRDWFFGRLAAVLEADSARSLFMTYSLCSSKLENRSLSKIHTSDKQLNAYLSLHQMTQIELGRVSIIVAALHENPVFFTPKVQNLIQVADKVELATFLRYLSLLPNPEDFQMVAVEALRTNITPVFDALSQKNPYPGLYFDDAQWNQMYLKAAFMQCDLSGILDVDKRSNADLARIIADYAHERWAASRPVDPYFWRPTTKFLDDLLLEDMSRLFRSNDPIENRAAALCCYHSANESALAMLENYPELKESVQGNCITWENLKR
ncbi:MAG: hypothetical protein ED555_13260 [Allomuricauda sp.]|nr:MAG: hypothetical protein ED555_13260 [Allomuricauda sp.]